MSEILTKFCIEWAIKIKIWKKIVRTHFRTKLISKNLPVSFAVFLIKTQIHIFLIINKKRTKKFDITTTILEKEIVKSLRLELCFHIFSKKNRENAPVRRIFIMQAKCGIKKVFQTYRFLTYRWCWSVLHENLKIMKRKVNLILLSFSLLFNL